MSSRRARVQDDGLPKGATIVDRSEVPQGGDALMEKILDAENLEYEFLRVEVPSPAFTKIKHQDNQEQIRGRTDTVTVGEYSQSIEQGEPLPPITVDYDFQKVDGHHRVLAFDKLVPKTDAEAVHSDD